MYNDSAVFCVIILFIFQISTTNGAKILASFLSPTYSHQIVYQPIWKELSLRGHQITVLTPNPLNDKSLTNLTEIDLSYSYAISKSHNVSTLGNQDLSATERLNRFINGYVEIVDYQLSHPQVQDLINNNHQYDFDLFLVEFLNPVMYTFKDVYQCPMIGITSLGLRGTQHELIGNPNHVIVNPDIFLPFSSNLSFTERVQSTVSYLIGWVLYRFKIEPIYTDLQRKHFPDSRRTLSELSKDVSLVIANSNYALRNVRPTVPGYIEVAGMHIIKSPTSLPKDLQEFLDNAENGAIYFSLGSNVDCNLLSTEKIDALLSTLSQLPYKILWKYGQDSLPNLSPNIMVKQWLPQQEVLAHKNVKLFITQGGLQSIEEAVHFKVPLLVMPQFADQHYNAHHMVERGVGLSTDFFRFDTNELEQKIIEIISNPVYKDNIKKLSNILTDQPIPSLDKAIWWIEYVLRHNGAAHLRYSAGLDIPFWQYYFIDVIIFLFVLTYLVSYFLLKTCKYIVKHISYYVINSWQCKKHID